MSEWVVKFKPVKVISLTQQGAEEAAAKMVYQGTVESEIVKGGAIPAYKGTYEYYESMLDALQCLYSEYLMELTPDQVSYMLDNDLMFMEEV